MGKKRKALLVAVIFGWAVILGSMGVHAVGWTERANAIMWTEVPNMLFVCCGPQQPQPQQQKRRKKKSD